MKRFLLFTVIFLLSVVTLTGCSSHPYPYPRNEFLQESWPGAVVTNPSGWTQGADRWFFTGEPNQTELDNRRAPFAASVSTMMVKVPNFSNIRVNGDFQVQIFGTYDHNSVYAFGPNAGVRSVLVQVRNNTLCVLHVADD